MIHTDPFHLARGGIEAIVLPAEGGALTELSVAGRSVLARTPWAHDVTPEPTPAPSETEWVRRWRGGWQLCFPSAGLVDEASPWPQGFHGVASQAQWRVGLFNDAEVFLEWRDEQGLSAGRRWQLTDRGVRVDTSVRNESGMTRPLVIAEHLVLGGDLIAPVVAGDAEFAIRPSADAMLAHLDYSGKPDGAAVPWPGRAEDRWAHLDRTTPARVAALVDVDPRVIQMEATHARVTLVWHCLPDTLLPHALLWEELAQSAEPPWNRSVVGVGIEPTSAPHGMGTANPAGTINLEPGGSLRWITELAVEWKSTPEEEQ